MTEPTTTYYLEMRSPTALHPKTDDKGLVIQECEIKQFEFNRFLYQLVGANWKWTTRLVWTDEQWQDYIGQNSAGQKSVGQNNVRTWVAYKQGAIAGYYELIHADTNTEIKSFGLTTQFIGKGMGGYFLSHAIQSAWNWKNTQRVWVHTCTDDHPSALQNYKARGFSIYRTE